jgi:phosphatidylserine synthase
MIKIDDNIADIIITNTDIFKNVHPNIITLVGIVCNYFILNEIDNMQISPINGTYFAFLLLIRFLADCLDGAVARKYKKTSKLGNILDTMSDIFMIRFNLPNWYIIFFIFAMCIINEKYSLFTSHESIKNNDGNIIDLVVSFFTNNSIVIFALFYFLVMKFK